MDVDITVDDHQASLRAAWKGNRPRRDRSRWLIVTVVLGLVAGYGLKSLALSMGFGIHEGSAVGGAALFVGYFALHRRDVLRSMRRSGPSLVLGHHTFEFTDEGIRESSEHTEGLVRWSGVREPLESDAHFFTMVGRTAGFCVPKRDLAGPDEEQALRSIVTSHTRSDVRKV